MKDLHESMPPEHRQIALLAALSACAFSAPVYPALASPLSSVDFKSLAVRCSPAVSADTLAAVAHSESGTDPWALHDNTTRTSIKPHSLEEARRDATQFLGDGDSVDIGLMQINSANLSALGMTTADALDPCKSLAGGAAVLRAAYGKSDTDTSQNVALLLALSRYNTGTPFKGIMNGYARTVVQDTETGNTSSSAIANSSAQARDPNAPPTWNVWASAAYARSHDASWLVTSNADPGQP